MSCTAELLPRTSHILPFVPFQVLMPYKNALDDSFARIGFCTMPFARACFYETKRNINLAYYYEHFSFTSLVPCLHGGPFYKNKNKKS